MERDNLNCIPQNFTMTRAQPPLLRAQFEGALYSLAFTQPAWSIRGRGLFEGRELFEEIRYIQHDVSIPSLNMQLVT